MVEEAWRDEGEKLLEGIEAVEPHEVIRALLLSTVIVTEGFSQVPAHRIYTEPP